MQILQPNSNPLLFPRSRQVNSSTEQKLSGFAISISKKPMGNKPRTTTCEPQLIRRNHVDDTLKITGIRPAKLFNPMRSTQTKDGFSTHDTSDMAASTNLAFFLYFLKNNDLPTRARVLAFFMADDSHIRRKESRPTRPRLST